jgi:hypothetical protein
MNLETLPDTRPAPAVVTGELEVRVRGSIRGYVRDFHLLTTGSGLVLRGSARSYYAKQLPQQAVMRAAPLPILANEIEVIPRRPATANTLGLNDP